jgi:hypothetical protein
MRTLQLHTPRRCGLCFQSLQEAVYLLARCLLRFSLCLRQGDAQTSTEQRGEGQGSMEKKREVLGLGKYKSSWGGCPTPPIGWLRPCLQAPLLCNPTALLPASKRKQIQYPSLQLHRGKGRREREDLCVVVLDKPLYIFQCP